MQIFSKFIAIFAGLELGNETYLIFGFSLKKLIIKHKHANDLCSLLSGLLSDQRIEFAYTSGAGSYELWIETPTNGMVMIK